VDTSLLGGASAFHEEGTFASLWHNLRDVFFPVKLPPLVLESKPVPVVDRMATKQNPLATALAAVIYIILALLLWVMVKQTMHQIALKKQMDLTNVVVPPPMPVAKDQMHGGGGQHDNAPVSQGKLPKFADQQITPPKAPPMEQPKIRMPDATIEVQPNLKMANSSLPNFGMPNSPLVGNSMGNGRGTGIGSGSGSGLGAGSGGGYGGGAKQIGGGVSQPIPIYQPDAEFSEEARKAKFQGVVTVSIIVDEHGRPQNVHVTRGVGMGLDEKAIEAVQQYRFKPARENGKPVAVYLNVEVNFEIF
jgi:protein TonB